MIRIYSSESAEFIYCMIQETYQFARHTLQSAWDHRKGQREYLVRDQGMIRIHSFEFYEESGRHKGSEKALGTEWWRSYQDRSQD